MTAWGGPLVLFAVLAIVLFAPASLGGKVLSGSDLLLFSSPFPPQPPNTQPENKLQYDAAYVFEPDQLQVRAALRSFDLPTWTSKLSAGRFLLSSLSLAWMNSLRLRSRSMASLLNSPRRFSSLSR